MTAVTREEISEWFDEGVTKGATHLIVVVDTFDYEDYPVYVIPGENASAKYEEYNRKNMQSVMEVYCLTRDKEKQLNERRSFNFD